MLESVEETFTHLQKLGQSAINAGLLAQIEGHDPTPDILLLRANLLRRSGDMAGARAAFAAWIATGAAPGAPAFESWSAIPPGLYSHGGHAIAPIVLVDDFLPVEQMCALHAHACERQAEFRDALATNEDAPPAYDPERRRTLVDYAFTLEREFFHSFVEDNLGRLAASFGTPSFAIDRVELKLTNHVDGGFFKAHSDNHAPYGEAGRAITWLYYFGAEEPEFTGGELYVLDCKPAEQSLSPAWFSQIRAIPNRLVAFPSWFYHAVGPTTLASGRFEHGRFAVSSHVRKRHDGERAWWES